MERNLWEIGIQILPTILMAIVGGWVRGMILTAKIEILEAIDKRFVSKDEFQALENRVDDLREDFREFRKGKV